MIHQPLENHLENLMKQKKIRSGSYCIAKDGEIVFCHAKGGMDLGDGTIKPVRTDTFFEIQSITKWITAAAILILMERGKLALTDRAGRYIEDFNRSPFSEITILQLLTHTSGLVGLWETFPDRNLHWEAHVDERDVAHSWIRAVLEMGLFYKPGTRWEYSMIGFCVLGEIIARITGMRAEDFIREEILLPCDMTETHWKREITPEWAARYQVRTDKHRRQYALANLGPDAWVDYCAIWPEIPETAGGLMSTLQDVIRFGMMLANDGQTNERTILRESSIRLFEENQLLPGVRDFCWDHGGKNIAYGAGCAVCLPPFDSSPNIGEHTMYHEGAGACALMVNRRKRLAAVWDTPFWTEDVWYTEPFSQTAEIIWNIW